MWSGCAASHILSCFSFLTYIVEIPGGSEIWWYVFFKRGVADYRNNNNIKNYDDHINCDDIKCVIIIKDFDDTKICGDIRKCDDVNQVQEVGKEIVKTDAVA